jgi:putative membrane protein
MKLASHIIGAVVVNALALWITSLFLPNFYLTPKLVDILGVALIFTALNYLVRPILKFMLLPFIVLTLGLGLLVINGFMLFLLDLLSKDITIQGVPTLIYATLIVGVVNFVFHLFT